jgi:phosphoenolpyruvate-protein kinase (PTS system EI component)
MTKDGRKIEVAAKIVSPQEADTVFANGAQGIGLFAALKCFICRIDSVPSEDRQF